MLYHISKYGHHHVAISHLFSAVALQSLQHVLETCLEAPYGEALFGHKEDGERTLAIIKRSKDYDALNVELKIIHLMYIHLLVCMLILWNAFIQLNVFMGCTYFSPLCAWVKCAVGLAHPVPCDEPLRLAELNVLCTSIVAMLHFSDFRSRSQLVVLKRHESNKFEVCNRILEALTSLHWTSLNKVDSCKTSMPAPGRLVLRWGLSLALSETSSACKTLVCIFPGPRFAFATSHNQSKARRWTFDISAGERDCWWLKRRQLKQHEDALRVFSPIYSAYMGLSNIIDMPYPLYSIGNLTLIPLKLPKLRWCFLDFWNVFRGLGRLVLASLSALRLPVLSIGPSDSDSTVLPSGCMTWKGLGNHQAPHALYVCAHAWDWIVKTLEEDIGASTFFVYVTSAAIQYLLRKMI